VKDLTGDLTGTVEGSSGAAFKYGPNTANDVVWSDMTIQNNAVGIEAGGTGTFTLTDVTLSNTKDVSITGASTINFIEGDLDTATVEVTGSGIFN